MDLRRALVPLPAHKLGFLTGSRRRISETYSDPRRGTIILTPPPPGTVLNVTPSEWKSVLMVTLFISFLFLMRGKALIRIRPVGLSLSILWSIRDLVVLMRHDWILHLDSSSLILTEKTVLFILDVVEERETQSTWHDQKVFRRDCCVPNITISQLCVAWKLHIFIV